MSKNNKKSRVSIRTLTMSAKEALLAKEWDDWWEWEYSPQGDDPEALDALKDAVLSRYSAEHWRVIRKIEDPWAFWMKHTQRVYAVYDLINAELWMLHGLPYGERKRYAWEAAERIWEAVLDYRDPSKHRELDLIDALDGGWNDRYDRDQCLECVDASCRWYAERTSSYFRLSR